MISKIKIIILCIVSVILISLGITVAVQSKRINSLQQELSFANANEKALLLANDSNKNKIRSLQLTVDQLSYFNDSIILKLNDAKQQLKIKDDNLKELQYLKTLATKTDTITIRDTIFKEQLYLDTIIGDQWYNMQLSLQYPNKIITTPSFISEKSIITSVKKETIKPPKKCKFARLFQKKHKVVVVEIQEKNPYVSTEEFKHIQIITQ